MTRQSRPADEISSRREDEALRGALGQVKLSDSRRRAIAEAARASVDTRDARHEQPAVADEGALRTLTLRPHAADRRWRRPALAASFVVVIVAALILGSQLHRLTQSPQTARSGEDPGPASSQTQSQTQTETDGVTTTSTEAPSSPSSERDDDDASAPWSLGREDVLRRMVEAGYIRDDKLDELDVRLVYPPTQSMSALERYNAERLRRHGLAIWIAFRAAPDDPNDVWEGPPCVFGAASELAQLPAIPTLVEELDLDGEGDAELMIYCYQDQSFYSYDSYIALVRRDGQRSFHSVGYRSARLQFMIEPEKAARPADRILYDVWRSDELLDTEEHEGRIRLIWEGATPVLGIEHADADKAPAIWFEPQAGTPLHYPYGSGAWLDVDEDGRPVTMPAESSTD